MAKGNLYLIDKYTGGRVSTQANKIVEFSAANNTPVVLVDNLSNQSSAELAVDAAGDIWYEDGTGNSYYIAAGTSTTVSLSEYHITGERGDWRLNPLGSRRQLLRQLVGASGRSLLAGIALDRSWLAQRPSRDCCRLLR